VDEGVVEGGEDTGNAENELAWYTLTFCPHLHLKWTRKHTISGQRAERDVLLRGGGLLGRHLVTVVDRGLCGWNMERERNKMKLSRCDCRLARRKPAVCALEFPSKTMIGLLPPVRTLGPEGSEMLPYPA